MNPPKLLVDENLSPVVAIALRNDGSDAVHVRDRGMNAATDLDVFAKAYQEDRIVVTLNVADFETLARSSTLHAGLILLPPGSFGRDKQLALVRTAWALVLAEHRAGRAMVNRALYLEHEGGFRFESLPPPY